MTDQLKTTITPDDVPLLLPPPEVKGAQASALFTSLLGEIPVAGPFAKALFGARAARKRVASDEKLVEFATTLWAVVKGHHDQLDHLQRQVGRLGHRFRALWNAVAKLDPAIAELRRQLQEVVQEPPIVERLYVLLDRINPEIVPRLETGDAVAVMIAAPNEMQLHQLMAEPDIHSVVRVSGTGSSIIASAGCRIGGHLHDQLDGLDMRGYRLQLAGLKQN